MELIDVLNPDGSPTGKSLSRDEVHERGLWHKAVHIWFINSLNEVLVQKRSANKKSHPGKYDISAAGHLSAGDTSIVGALREVEEELGIQLKEIDLIKIGEVKQEGTEHQGTYINKEYNDVYVVHKDIPIHDFVIQENEVEKVMYVPIQELKRWVTEYKSDLVMHTGEFKILFAYLEA